MRFICDVHIPVRLSKFLVAKGFKSWHINQLLEGSRTSDVAICDYADQHDCIVITKDSDFKDSYFVHKTPRKLVRICLGNIANDSLLAVFDGILPQIHQLNGETHFYLEIREDQIILFD